MWQIHDPSVGLPILADPPGSEEESSRNEALKHHPVFTFSFPAVRKAHQASMSGTS